MNVTTSPSPTTAIAAATNVAVLRRLGLVTTDPPCMRRSVRPPCGSPPGHGHSAIRPIRTAIAAHYRSRVRTVLRQLWRLPAPADAHPAARWEVAAVGAIAVLAVLEAAVWQPDLAWRWVSLAVFLVWLPTLLVRRTRPLLMAAVFAVVAPVPLGIGFVEGTAPEELGTAVVGLLIPYSLTRWARGRDLVIGLGLFLLVAVTSLATQPLLPADRLGGSAVIVAAAATGAAVRARSLLRGRQLEDVRRDERERLARDLHDTVAHHLTAIAISAQAGLAVADSRPDAARDALRRIDAEATRTLSETRRVVRMLRTADEAPDRPLEDMAGLAAAAGPGPAVEVTLDERLELSPTVAAALHRIAQEAVANARRHAADVTEVRVEVTARGDDLELTVTDDGAPVARRASGFGILGMTERAALLGGSLEAGPAEPRGWRVRAVLPMEEVR
jgi:signal transduction histidine kinase